MRTIDVHPIIDNARFSAFHWMIMAWCGLLLIFDGYDLFIYGVVLPVIMKEWGLSPLQAGALGSYALFGMMFGALAFGSLADRIGRKKGIAICFALFSGATILNGFASSPSEFGIYRFIAGLGCGGLMPNAVALMNEYAPKRLRSTLVALMFSGYSLGGMLSAGVGIVMLPRFGWESMFFAAAIPLLLLPVILYYLPESIGFLVRQGRTEQARTLLKRLAPGCDVMPGDQLQAAERKGEGGSVLDLFRNGLATRTLALWLAFFCCLLMVYALSAWLPKLMANAGYSLGSSLSFLLALNFGGMAGAILGGWLGDRYNLVKVKVAFFLAAALSISLLGVNSPMPVLYLLIFIAGATTIGTQILLYAGAAQLYGLSVRSTGLGWASGIGRNGAIVGPLLGGALMGINLPLQLNFIAFAIPGAIAALAMAVHLASGRRHAQVAAA
ncbi:aromatic acid/H+ symport family MFS transporter [Pseudomonas putida]|uniref:Aromatic acid/H+ symport family MFS transporter n=1 Tax=Pseudomonas putida TaxID=303 RepID=A0A7W2L6B2_PSEPU|nr:MULTISPECIES: aromatic acid/H+ symport family MFS transporter [Pseudomonas]MBA6119249.1 aromatic acid/H+ symport family MFS transporter [Pseudomonas putida]MBI6944577.1 aromatic acid/H+ symport family MFS transporter [Pseudomonas putida]MBI6960920.1 aromatic acid/H+ symport family MFS transporter [Pseudomonas putida]MCZ9639704.1 aromatic acid/H+ symport family MFS transporter [Pseudomonas putida]MEC4878528.1 aromatic acid/H+ symport family MFS transporter [Pseudomonas sp. NC26]